MEQGGCAGRCEGGWVVRVSLREVGGCQRLVDHLRMERRLYLFHTAHIRGIPDTSYKFIDSSLYFTLWIIYRRILLTKVP